MASRNARETKTDAVYAAARKIIEAEGMQHRLKTERLRALRLAKQAETEADAPGTPSPRAEPTKRAARRAAQG